MENQNSSSSNIVASIEELKNKIAQQDDSVEEIDKAHYIFELAKLYKKNNQIPEALESFKETIEKTQSFNTKVDSIFEILHIGINDKNLELLKEYLDKCKALLKDAGDWEKKNRLKVYDGINYVLNRNFKEAGKLFLQALMTFTSYELFDYKTFVFYTAITNIITVDRKTLKTRVIDNSDVVSCINEIPHLEKFLMCFYEGDYATFFKEFYAIVQRIKKDFFFSQHSYFFMREMRVKVYSQFLQSYKSVTIDNMAKVFGVSSKFIDTELSNFISLGRLPAKIDKVSGVIECTQDEPTVDLYNNIISESDRLLNKVHKLSKLLEL
jgi:26S proteasome regulatory subunit N7